MRRFTLGLALAGMLGAGMLLGSVWTPGAHGGTPATATATARPADYGAPGMNAQPPFGGAYPPPGTAYPLYSTSRWQVYTFYNANPAVNQSSYLVILLDGQTGESFLLRPDITQTSASWVRIDRR